MRFEDRGEVRAHLEEALHQNGWRGRRIRRLVRRPFPYRTSCAIEELDLVMNDRSRLRVLLKNLSPCAAHPRARRTKPPFLLDPGREIEVYRRFLAPRGIGPGFRGAVSDPASQRYWLFIDRFPGKDLRQVGNIDVWLSVARWLAAFHGELSVDRSVATASEGGLLIRYDESFYRTWIRRASTFTGDDRRLSAATRQRIGAVAAAYDPIIARLSALPSTLIHGELYASNVMFGTPGGTPRICPVDWEMAGGGPGLVDLAALVSGDWTNPERSLIADAYRCEAEGHGSARSRNAIPWASPEEFQELLDCCRLHLAIQWLGWSRAWTPPEEHARDWAADALELAERIGI